MSVEFTFFHRPVRSRVGRLLMAPVLILISVAILLTLPVTAPLNWLLKKAGRRGFGRRAKDGRWSWDIDLDAFRAV